MKITRLTTLLCLIVLSGWASGGTEEYKQPMAANALQTIPSLDIARYMGTWYEIAKYPNLFQKNCVGDTRANYSPMAGGRVKVVNQCRAAGGIQTEAVGEARQIGPSNSAKLEVRFAPAWLSFLPFVWGDYWVIELDDDYQWVVVSEPKKEYLWILSRASKMDPIQYNALLSKLRQKAFDLNKLELTPQEQH